ncbi:Sphingomyelinase C 2 [Neolecta irregularis DAH-3]|uniref:Sphingomyelinase C 2 n=1 Tax=Neolecta irregularis (strain DAH-3) TaxID=1198029 RepID=A0A1U7LSS0_NEOID|nr:Sphingomyelinase C 2 [Neolecta irregularis DAH-3]|eukprot:OLL25694.1 Sphingomyelinase C 2 [Neolecta irregularis DAH-3]
MHRNELLSKTIHQYRYELNRGKSLAIFNGGVVILSKYAIVEKAGEVYHSRTRWDRFAAKGIAFVRLDVDGMMLDVYGTHMQSGDKNSEQEARLAQASQVAEFIKRNSSQDSKIVFGGDINMGPVLDPTFQKFSAHYTDEQDVRARHKAYETLKTKSGLEDIVSEEPEFLEDINRFLGRNLGEKKVTYLGLERCEDGSRLSDSQSVLLTITI